MVENRYSVPEISEEVVIRDDEGLSKDALFTFTIFDDETEETIKIGEVNVKLYEDNWSEPWYAADADGAHEHIFGGVVSYESGMTYEKYIKLKEIQRETVWGRVAVIDQNFHSIIFEEGFKKKEYCRDFLSAVVAYLENTLSVDFILTDFSSLYTNGDNTGMYLLVKEGPINDDLLEDLRTDSLKEYFAIQGFNIIGTAHDTYYLKKSTPLFDTNIKTFIIKR